MARRAALVFAIAFAAAACGEKLDPIVVRGDALGPSACEPVDYTSAIRPLLEMRCVRCHGGENTNAGVVLTSYEGAAASAERANLRVQTGTMPPDGGLPDDERALFDAWVQAGAPELAEPVDCPDTVGGDADATP